MTFFEKVIVHVDMDAFFASVEQRDDPSLMGHPVVVTNGMSGHTIITCSYEARIYGIKTGMPLWEAQKKCDTLVRCPSRPDVYAEVSTSIMQALVNTITPNIEIFSVDECFLEIASGMSQWSSPQQLGNEIKQCIQNASGLTASVGISTNKTNAKYAVKLQKPNGLVWICAGEEEQSLVGVKTTELCGIANGIGRFLAKNGAVYCHQVKDIPLRVLEKRFGYLGKRIWLMCQGQDPDPVRTTVNAPKSMGHSKVLPPNSVDSRVIRLYARHVSQKLSDRLRQNKMWTQTIQVGAVFSDRGRLSMPISLPASTNQYTILSAMLLSFIRSIRLPNERICQVSIVALQPSSVCQNDLFQEKNESKLDRLLQDLNDKMGYHAVKRGSFLDDQQVSPNVISPSWRSNGPKQSLV